MGRKKGKGKKKEDGADVPTPHDEYGNEKVQTPELSSAQSGNLPLVKDMKEGNVAVAEPTSRVEDSDHQKVCTPKLSSNQLPRMTTGQRCENLDSLNIGMATKSEEKIGVSFDISRQKLYQIERARKEQPKDIPIAAATHSVWGKPKISTYINTTPKYEQSENNRDYQISKNVLRSASRVNVSQPLHSPSEPVLRPINNKKAISSRELHTPVSSTSANIDAAGIATPKPSVWGKPRTSTSVVTPNNQDLDVGNIKKDNPIATPVAPVWGRPGPSAHTIADENRSNNGKDIVHKLPLINIKQSLCPPNESQKTVENIRTLGPVLPTTSESKPSSNKAAGDFEFTIPTRRIANRAGTLGRKTKVFTNFFPLCINSKLNKAIHYDVTFTPDKPKRLVRIAFNKLVHDYFPGRYPAFDGSKNIYSSGPLFDCACFNVQVNIINPENNMENAFDICIKFAAYVDLTSLARYMNNGTALQIPQEALQCIDVVFRNILSCSNRFVQVGRSFFTPPTGRVIDLGDGLQLWHGVFTSTVLGWKPYLNIDVAHKGFPIQQLVSEYMKNSLEIDLKTGRFSDHQRDDCRKFIKGLRVQYILPQQPQSKRTYKINDISKLSAREQTFNTEDGTLLTIEHYYRRMRNYTIQYPNLPCLWVGSPLKNIYVPPELCTILPGQVVLKKLTENQTKNMIRNAATSTQVRRNKINDALRESGLTQDQPGLREFGLKIDNRFEQIDARILQPPILEYNSGTVVEPLQGVWKQKKFLAGAVLRIWTILNVDFHTQPRDITNFSKQVMDRAKDLGIDVKNSVYKPFYSIKGRQIYKELQQYFEETKMANIDLVFVIVPNFGDAYSLVKQAAELQYGILTQCLKAQTLRKMNLSTIDNILLKVNAKLNGINHIISPKHLVRPSVLNTPVIIVGADVTHPSPDQINIPSIVGVAASHDPAAFKYNMCWRLQKPKVEIIEDLETIMRDHLLYFYLRTRQKPSKILFFRDGVSEGQFKQVLNSELTAIRRACTSINESYKPAITMMVVQKRHHTRFFPNENEGVGKHLNVSPGIVVDTQITHPTELDFYLVSHQSIQGVARPTKYRKLWDDSNMSDDAIEELTYYLCHMFSRCTRAVSYPAPTYYAHLAAYRGRVYLEGQQIVLTNLENEQKQRQIHKDIQKNKPMFFV